MAVCGLFPTEGAVDRHRRLGNDNCECASCPPAELGRAANGSHASGHRCRSAVLLKRFIAVPTAVGNVFRKITRVCSFWLKGRREVAKGRKKSPCLVISMMYVVTHQELNTWGAAAARALHAAGATVAESRNSPIGAPTMGQLRIGPRLTLASGLGTQT